MSYQASPADELSSKEAYKLGDTSSLADVDELAQLGMLCVHVFVIVLWLEREATSNI